MNAAEKASRFEAIALPHLDAAYNLARWLTRNDQDAEDLVQMAYLRAYRFLDGFRGTDARAWLLTIVRNTYYSSLRDHRHEQADIGFDEQLHGRDDDELDASPYDIGADPEALLANQDARGAVDRALQRLPPNFREVIVLKEMDELSYKEIAQIVGVPIGTVMSRLARARKLLLGYLRDVTGE